MCLEGALWEEFLTFTQFQTSFSPWESFIHVKFRLQMSSQLRQPGKRLKGVISFQVTQDHRTRALRDGT